jgi:hypothetical protein
MMQSWPHATGHPSFSCFSAAHALCCSAGSAAAGAEPQVTAQGGPAFDAFKSIASNALGNLLHKKEETPVVQAAPAQPVATIVVPPQQVAAVPTTTSGISLKTDTPVTVASPINVTTPVKQKNVQVDLGKGGEDLGLLNTLINLGNLGANSLAAGGAITGAVAGFLNTFLPDCPPPIVGAPPIPGCQLFEVVGAGPARPGRRAGAVAPAAVKADSTQAAPKLTATGGPAAAGPAKPM